MINATILSIILACNISDTTTTNIRNTVIEDCQNRIWHDFHDLKNVLIKYVSPNITDNKIEDVLLSIGKEEYEIYLKDTSKFNALLYCINSILITYNGKKTDDFLKMTFRTGNNDLKIQISEYMILKSDQWFQCSKNVIDSIDIKYGYTFRIDFYYYLIKRYHATPENAPEIDSLKYLMYRALENEYWGNVAKIDSLYAKIEPGYVKSKQRLMILTKIDNKQVMELLKIRRDKYKKINSTADLDIEMAYDAYLKLKKEKNLEDYSPPVLK